VGKELLKKTGNLLPYYGGMPNHRPGAFVQWEEAEDRTGLERYMCEYRDPSLPERYRLDDEWGYAFNSLGFRGEEYDHSAMFHLFACGCSFTYGMGIKWEQTWPYVFKERLATKRGWSINQVNLLNFGQQAASNDYIARTILSQCARSRPDLVLALFTAKERAEFVQNNRIGSIGPWLQNEESLNYYRCYTEELGMINLLKNVLLVQQFCQIHEIPCLISIFYHAELSNPAFMDHPIIGSLMAQVRWENVCPFSLIDFRCDVGRMCHHPGPLSNLCFGRKLGVFYEKLMQSGMI
jgi:hypothetical protein